MPSKKRTAATAKQTARLAITKPKTRIADNTPADRKLNDLKKLHEKTNVTSNLKLPQGHRLKLDSPEQLKRKCRPFRDFNVEFADLKDTRPQNTEVEYLGNDTDDDDLPESHDILKTVSTAIEGRSSPSETNYSNSDLDSLIRAVPLDDNQEVFSTSITTSQDDSKRPGQQPGSLVASASTSPPTLKRKRETSPTSPTLECRNKLPKIVARTTCSSPMDRRPHVMVCLVSWPAIN
jgi:ATP-dependent DNA helicase HFM1/MER3